MPPTMAPILLPTTRSGRMPRLSSTRRTPMCARPLAPPPERTRAVRSGRQLWACPGTATRSATKRMMKGSIGQQNKGTHAPCAARSPFVYLCENAVSHGAMVPRSRRMTYVIVETCIGVKDRACVDVCPVDCIYEGEDQLYIHPDECIDCGACEPECPVTAIFPEEDVPGNMSSYIEKNKEVFNSETPPGRPNR